MAYSTTISPGAAPLLWSSVQEAFDQINQNFTELQLFFNDSTITPIDLTNLHTDLSPAYAEQYSLGSSTKRWRSLHTSEYTTIPGNEINGVWLGTAHIKGIGYTVDLPLNSTVDGELIIDPSKTFFSSVQVDNSNSIEAVSFNSILNLNSGTAIQLVVDSSAESIEINNTGVTQLYGTAGQVGVSASTGSITLTNLGVLSVSNTSTLPAGRPAGLGIAASGSTGNLTLTNTGVISIIQGPGITVSTDTATGQVQISNAAPAQVAYRTVHIVGDSITNDLVADSTSDTLNLDPGYGIILSANGSVDPANDILTIAIDPRIDITGSVFADNSSLMVDAVDNKLFATETNTDRIYTPLIQTARGYVPPLTITAGWSGETQGNMIIQTYSATSGYSGIIGVNTGQFVVENWNDSVSLGTMSFQNGTLTVSGSIIGTLTGDVTGSVFSDGSAMLVDSTGGKLVGPIDSTDGVNSIIMDQVSGLAIVSTSLVDIQGAAGAQIGIGAGTSGDVYIGSGSNQTIINGTLMAPIIDTTDSSAIQVIPSVNLNSDLTVGGDILPNIDLGGNLGSPDRQWNSLYVSGSTIFIGGVPVSVEGGQLTVNGSTVIGGGGGGGGPVAWNDVTSKPVFAAVATSGAYTDLSGRPTLAAVATSGSYIDLTNKPTIPSIGSITFVGTTVDSSDSSAIAFTPAVTFSSDITVQNELFVENDAFISGTLNVSSLNVTGAITSQGSGTPELFSDNEILLTAGTRVEISSSPLNLTAYTTAGRDAFSPMTGDIIYNTSLNEFQGYTGSSWKRFNVDLATVATTGSYTDLSNQPTSFSSLTLTGTTNLQQTSELLTTKTNATGTVEHDFTAGAIFYHSSISANFTANFTNVPTTNNKAMNILLVLAQGGTAYIPNAVQIDGAAQTIKWLGNSEPSGNINKTDLVSFTLIRVGSAWTVIGSLNTYG